MNMTEPIFRLPQEERLIYAHQYLGREVFVVHSPSRAKNDLEKTHRGILVSVGWMPHGTTNYMIAIRFPDKRYDMMLPLSQVRRISLVPQVQRVVRCDAHARRGSGTGICDRPLDAHGNCDRASDHLEEVT